MKKIKFSHDYYKLPPDWEETQAILLATQDCTLANLEKQCPQFLEYDTRFRGEEGHYDLDFNDAIVLIFFHIKTRMLFTTIRRYTPGKLTYYKTSVLETFLLERTVQEL